MKLIAPTAAAALLGLLWPTVGLVPAHAANPGPVTGTITLASGTSLSGYDIATDSAGTAYVAWIGDTLTTDKTVYLCVLPAGATGCAGGISSVSATDEANGRDLHVVSTSPGTATVVWFTQPTLDAGQLTSATYAGGALGAPVAAGPAPTNGDLKDVQVGPDGQVWAVTEDAASSVSNVIGVRDGLAGAPTNVTAAFPVGNANLAFDNGQPIVEVDHYGSVSDPAYVASGPSLAGFTPVAKTWTLGTEDIVTTSHGARLVTSQDDAGYHPVSGVWNGSTFAHLDLTGDLDACAPDSHDLVTDPSGRIADVTNECDKITVANMSDTRHSGIIQFPAGNTVAGGSPQIGSLADGTAWVAWSIEDGTAQSLLLTRVQLPATEVAKTLDKKGIAKLSLAGPVGCLPAVTVKPKAKVKVTGSYSVLSKSLSIDGKKLRHGKIKGAKLKSDSKHKLVLRVVLAPQAGGHHHGRPHGDHTTLKVGDSFTGC